MGKGGRIHSAQSYERLGSDHQYCYQESQGQARKGYVPVMVGKDRESMERLDVPTKIFEHPCIVDLLEMSADEFGHCQQGLIKIQCDPDSFRMMVKRLSKERRSGRGFSLPF